MPNWCANNFSLSGPKEKIEEIYNQITSKDESKGLLDALVSMPQEIRDTFKEGSESQDWYGWSIDNWGTKWEVDGEGLELQLEGDSNEASINGYFDSAWGPPTQAYETFLANNEDCSIWASYEEPGMDFAGIYDDGEIKHLDGLMDIVKEIVQDDLEKSDNELFNELDEEFDIVERNRDWILEEMENEDA